MNAESGEPPAEEDGSKHVCSFLMGETDDNVAFHVDSGSQGRVDRANQFRQVNLLLDLVERDRISTSVRICDISATGSIQPGCHIIVNDFGASPCWKLPRELQLSPFDLVAELYDRRLLENHCQIVEVDILDIVFLNPMLDLIQNIGWLTRDVCFAIHRGIGAKRALIRTAPRRKDANRSTEVPTVSVVRVEVNLHGK